MKRLPLILVLAVAVLSLALSGCGQHTPQVTGKVSFTIKVPSGPSAYPGFPPGGPNAHHRAARIQGREILPGTTYVDIAIWNDIGDSYTATIAIHSGESSATIGDIPVGDYTIEAIAYDDLCWSFTAARQSLTVNTGQNDVYMTLERFSFEVTGLPANVTCDSSFTLEGNWSSPTLSWPEYLDGFMSTVWYDEAGNELFWGNAVNDTPEVIAGIPTPISIDCYVPYDLISYMSGDTIYLGCFEFDYVQPVTGNWYYFAAELPVPGTTNGTVVTSGGATGSIEVIIQ